MQLHPCFEDMVANGIITEADSEAVEATLRHNVRSCVDTGMNHTRPGGRPAWRPAGTVEPTAEPASACPPALFATSITQMGLVCCPTDVDCDPPPTVCSAECAAFYVPFYEACSSTEMAAVGASGMADFTSIYDLCIARGH